MKDCEFLIMINLIFTLVLCLILLNFAVRTSICTSVTRRSVGKMALILELHDAV